LPLLAVCLAGAIVAAVIERRWETAPEFPLGLLVGELAVLATVGLDCAVLMAANSYWGPPALLFTLFHLPLAVLEGIILGFSLGFLAKVKPEMLGRTTEPTPPTPVSVEPVQKEHLNPCEV
jgi:ABC-type Co2+ transport system permease subunit